MTFVQQKMDFNKNSRKKSDDIKKESKKTKIEFKQKGNISVSAFCSRLIKQGINIGRNGMFKWLRDNGYISKQKQTWNMPIRKYEARNLLATKETFVIIADEQVPKYTPLITPYGAKYFTEKLSAQNKAPKNKKASR